MAAVHLWLLVGFTGLVCVLTAGVFWLGHVQDLRQPASEEDGS